MRRWNRFLCIAHVGLAVVLIGSEELHSWHQYEYMQSIENYTGKPFIGVQDPLSNDYWLDSRERTLHSLNIPASMVVGWYGHPMSNYVSSLAGSLLLSVLKSASVKTRVGISDAVLLCGIALQWWLIGLWIQHTSRFARFRKATVCCMTVLGAVMTLVSVPKPLAEVELLQHAVEAASLLLLLAWILMIGAGIVELGLFGIRKVLPNHTALFVE
jgi:hypothetical protein